MNIQQTIATEMHAKEHLTLNEQLEVIQEKMDLIGFSHDHGYTTTEFRMLSERRDQIKKQIGAAK